MTEFCFRSISFKQMDILLPNFIYLFIVRRFRLGLLPGTLHKFVTGLWSLIDVRIIFMVHIFRTNGPNFTKCCI